MIKTIVCLFMCVFCCVLGTKAYPEKVVLDSRALMAEQVGDRMILVLSTIDGGPQWFVVSEWDARQLNRTPPTLHVIDSLSASPDGKYLAVLSVGEGHPMIHVLDLPALMSDQKTSLVLEINPYPGTVNIVGWNGNRLRMESDMLLSIGQKQGLVHEALMLFSNEPFELDMISGNIESRSESLKQPVEYYGTHLLDSPDEYSPEPELNALRALNDVRALPYLEKALALSRYSNDKTAIGDLILHLKKKPPAP